MVSTNPTEMLIRQAIRPTEPRLSFMTNFSTSLLLKLLLTKTLHAYKEIDKMFMRHY